MSLCCGALSLKLLLETGVHVPTQKLKNRDHYNSDRNSYVASRNLSTDVLIMDSYGLNVMVSVSKVMSLNVSFCPFKPKLVILCFSHSALEKSKNNEEKAKNKCPEK